MTNAILKIKEESNCFSTLVARRKMIIIKILVPCEGGLENLT